MILCFSGTGNSRAVAGWLAAALGEDVTLIDRRFLDSRPDARDTERVVWVFPVYSWGVPPVVLEAIRLFGVSGRRNYAVCTCGDDVGLMPRMLRAALAGCGAGLSGVWSVIMPNNYVTMKGFDVDPADVVGAKLEAAPARVREIARQIAMRVTGVTDVVKGRFAWLKTRVVYPWFVRHAMSPELFHVTDDCVGCGKCAAVCPMENISMENAHPRWSDRCAFCLACYHVCPCHAVAYGSATRNKGQYRRFLSDH